MNKKNNYILKKNNRLPININIAGRIKLLREVFRVAKKQINIIILVGILVLITATSGCIDTALDFMDYQLYEYDGPDKLNNSDTSSESGADESYVEENEPYVEQMTGSSSSSGEWVEVNPNHPEPLFNSEPED
ncbi:MAG: hypothetical protein Q4P17_04115 [Methanobacterium sp.]|nr:hypothetical protein [Methanobacterium sp.]